MTLPDSVADLVHLPLSLRLAIRDHAFDRACGMLDWLSSYLRAQADHWSEIPDAFWGDVRHHSHYLSPEETDPKEYRLLGWLGVILSFAPRLTREEMIEDAKRALERTDLLGGWAIKGLVNRPDAPAAEMIRYAYSPRDLAVFATTDPARRDPVVQRHLLTPLFVEGATAGVLASFYEALDEAGRSTVIDLMTNASFIPSHYIKFLRHLSPEDRKGALAGILARGSGIIREHLMTVAPEILGAPDPQARRRARGT